MAVGVVDRIRATHLRHREEVARANRTKAKEEAEQDQAIKVGQRWAARRIAMNCAQQMTGRVIFPARWATEYSKEGRGFGVVHCTETLEGLVEIVVTVAIAGGHVESVIVRRPGAERGMSWSRPSWAATSKGPDPMPDADWFERAVVSAGILDRRAGR